MSSFEEGSVVILKALKPTEMTAQGILLIGSEESVQGAKRLVSTSVAWIRILCLSLDDPSFLVCLFMHPKPKP